MHVRWRDCASLILQLSHLHQEVSSSLNQTNTFISFNNIFSACLLVLCAFGDAMTTLRHEVSRTFISDLSSISSIAFTSACSELASKASSVLEQQGIPLERQKVQFQADMRYNGQALTLPISFELEDIGAKEKDENHFEVLKER